VYEYFKGKTSPQEQIDALEKALQEIRAKGNKPPPGFHAHLGMLYASVGNGQQAVQEFQAEKDLFPESAAYMDFRGCQDFRVQGGLSNYTEGRTNRSA